MKFLSLCLISLSGLACSSVYANNLQLSLHDFNPTTFRFMSENWQEYQLTGNCKFTTQDINQSFELKQSHSILSTKEKWTLYYQNKKYCTIDTVALAPQPVAAVVPPPPEQIHTISTMDHFSRSFVTDLSDLPPMYNSHKPSAALLFKNSKNAKLNNMALCNGFVGLKTTTTLEDHEGIQEQDQVVTKIITTHTLDQNENNCNTILSAVDYSATKYLLDDVKQKNQRDLTMSTGPFVAVFHPNSQRINQLIDLSQYSEQEVLKFGENWSVLFQQTYHINQTTNQPLEEVLPSKLRSTMNFFVCDQDSLLYVFNQKLGQLGTLACKAYDEHKSNS